MDMQTQAEQKPTAHSELQHRGLLTRQPLSTLGKIAAWCYVLATIASIGGVIALTLTNGAPSRDIVIVAIVSLVITLLIVSGVRWMQMGGALLSVVNLYLLFTEPFVLQSLMEPKTDPQGGFGHYIGTILIIANALLAFAALIGTVLQNYGVIDRKMPRWYPSVIGGVVGLVVSSLFIGAIVQPAAPAAATLTYTNGVPTVHMKPGGFNLTSVTITKGSKLLLVDDTNEQHVIANGSWQNNAPVQKSESGAPVVNNITFNGNSATVGPFAMAGTYHLLCMIHRGMELTIIVQ